MAKTLEVRIYADEYVDSTSINYAQDALSALDNQVNFDINYYYHHDMPYSETQCSAYMFEDWLHNQGYLTDNVHFMLLDSCNNGGGALYHVGQYLKQEYNMSYGISRSSTLTNIGHYQNRIIQELGHTIMQTSDCSASDGTHSCGGILSSDRCSPMITGYVDTADQENWTICTGSPSSWNGGYDTSITSCTKSNMENYVSTYI